MLNTKDVSQETKDSLSGVVWFILLIPVAMAMFFFAEYYVRIEFTIMGWFIATLGAVQLGFGLARGGKRLFSLPLRSKVTN